MSSVQVTGHSVVHARSVVQVEEILMCGSRSRPGRSAARGVRQSAVSNDQAFRSESPPIFDVRKRFRCRMECRACDRCDWRCSRVSRSRRSCLDSASQSRVCCRILHFHFRRSFFLSRQDFCQSRTSHLVTCHCIFSACPTGCGGQPGQLRV